MIEAVLEEPAPVFQLESRSRESHVNILVKAKDEHDGHGNDHQQQKRQQRRRKQHPRSSVKALFLHRPFCHSPPPLSRAPCIKLLQLAALLEVGSSTFCK